ncbi:hypothetical protein Tco_0078225 [Tanacetum coccineum]
MSSNKLKNDKFCKDKGVNVFRKKREQYVEIQDLKAQMQDKNMAISELKKLIEKCKGKSVDTKFDKPSVVRQPNAQRIPKPSVLGKPAPFSDSLEEKNIFARKSQVPKNNESVGFFSKPVHSTGIYLRQHAANTNPRASTSTGVAHKTNVSRPQPRSNQMKDKVVPYPSHAKLKKTEVEDHHTYDGDNVSLAVPILLEKILGWGWELVLAGSLSSKVGCLQSPIFSRGYSSDEDVGVSKAKRSSFKSKTVPSSKGRLNLLHMDLCGPMRVASINGKKYILVASLGEDVQDLCAYAAHKSFQFTRWTWKTHFLMSIEGGRICCTKTDS